jgi:hypothetical protein
MVISPIKNISGRIPALMVSARQDLTIIAGTRPIEQFHAPTPISRVQQRKAEVFPSASAKLEKVLPSARNNHSERAERLS